MHHSVLILSHKNPQIVLTDPIFPHYITPYSKFMHNVRITEEIQFATVHPPV